MTKLTRVTVSGITAAFNILSIMLNILAMNPVGIIISLVLLALTVLNINASLRLDS